jgi:hypothetical protein
VEEFVPPGNFDTAILSNALKQIANRIPFLQKLNNHIQPGRFLMRVLMFNRDWHLPLKKLLGFPYYPDDTYHIEYTQESFEQEMTGAGLCVNHLKIRWVEIRPKVVPNA